MRLPFMDASKYCSFREATFHVAFFKSHAQDWLSDRMKNLVLDVVAGKLDIKLCHSALDDVSEKRHARYASAGIVSADARRDRIETLQFVPREYPLVTGCSIGLTDLLKSGHSDRMTRQLFTLHLEIPKLRERLLTAEITVSTSFWVPLAGIVSPHARIFEALVSAKPQMLSNC